MAKASTRNQKVGRDPPVEKHCFKCLICFIKVKYILYQGRQDSFDLGPNLEITFHLGQLYLPDLITYVQNSICYTIHNLFFSLVVIWSQIWHMFCFSVWQKWSREAKIISWKATCGQHAAICPGL